METHVIAAIGFDLDFTLYDQAAFVLPFFRRVAPALSRLARVTPEAVFDVLHRVWCEKTPRYGNMFDEALQILQIHEAGQVAELVRAYRAWRPPLELYAGVRATLETLGRRFPLVLITDGHAAVQRHKVDALGIGPFFAATVYTDEFGRGWQKPNVEPFLYAAELVGAPPRDCVFVGDNPAADLEGARRAGMAAVRVLTGPYAKQDWPAPDGTTLASVTELEEALGVRA